MLPREPINNQQKYMYLFINYIQIRFYMMYFPLGLIIETRLCCSSPHGRLGGIMDKGWADRARKMGNSFR